MTGLDRAAIWCDLEIDSDLVTIGIRKKYPNIAPKKLSGNNQTYLINSENINEIRIKEKQWSTLIKIDFSYSRNNSSNNIYPLDNELSKVLIEEKLLKIIQEITLQEVKREQLFYEYLEYTIQEEIDSFYNYYNITSCFYRGLMREMSANNSIQFSDYNTEKDYFYSTGFIFQPSKGWKIRLYSKSLENNKKNIKEKITKPVMRLEHRLSQTMLKNICKSNNVKALTIDFLEKSIDGMVGRYLFNIVKAEIKRDIEILIKNFKNFNSRKLETLVRNNQEHILDEKIINAVIVQLSNKSDRQNRRYKDKIATILDECDTRGSPKRTNFKNIDRLKFFIEKMLKIKIKIKITSNEEVIVFY